MSEQWYLTVAGIPGESTSDRYRGAIEIQSWSWGVTGGGSAASGSGGGTGKPTFHDLAVVARISKASPPLLKACASGTHIKTITLVGVKPGPDVEFLTYTLTDAVVTSVHQGDAETGAPIEQVSFGFAKVQVEYRPQTATGRPAAPVVFGYDVKAHKKL